MGASSSRFLSISDLRARWSCSRATVYRAISEMERGNYLKRIFIGRGSDQRISLDSVERWEQLHAEPEDAQRCEVVKLRQKTSRRKSKAPPKVAGADELRDFANSLFDS